MTLEQERDKLADMNVHLTAKCRRMERAINDYFTFYEWHMTAPSEEILDLLPKRRAEINKRLRDAQTAVPDGR